MSDFTLEPEEIEPDRPERARPVRLVATGLAPTAEVPTKRRRKDFPPCYAPCPTCQGPVLTGATASGELLALDLHVPTYVVLWLPDTPRPLLQGSRGYPVHQCH